MRQITLLFISALLFASIPILQAQSIPAAAEVTGSQRVNVRSCPQTDCPVIGTLAQGDIVSVIDIVQGHTISNSRDWYKIEFAGGQAFVHSSLLTPSSESPTVISKDSSKGVGQDSDETLSLTTPKDVQPETIPQITLTGDCQVDTTRWADAILPYFDPVYALMDEMDFDSRAEVQALSDQLHALSIQIAKLNYPSCAYYLRSSMIGVIEAYADAAESAAAGDIDGFLDAVLELGAQRERLNREFEALTGEPLFDEGRST